MIIDDITHLKDYIRLLPMLKTVVGFLDSHDLQALPEGRFEWDADGCFVNLPAQGSDSSRSRITQENDRHTNTSYGR